MYFNKYLSIHFIEVLNLIHYNNCVYEFIYAFYLIIFYNSVFEQLIRIISVTLLS